MRPASAVTTMLRFALGGLALAATASWSFLAAAHAADRYRVGHAQGVWMALARYASNGVLYPPIYDGEHIGGTRYMPLQIVVNAAGSKITGEYLTSGKIVAFLTTTALLLVVFRLLRRKGCPVYLAGGLTATIIVTEAGLHVGTTLGADVLPALLQICLVAVVAKDRAGPRSTIVAAGLGGLAVAAKITAVWGFLAVMCWYLASGRRRDAARFAGAFAIATLLLLGLGELMSGGRMSQNLLLLLLSGGVGIKALGRAPNQLIINLGELAVAAWVLVPFAVLAVLMVGSWRELTLEQWALGWSLIVLLVALSDIGTGYNQLIDVEALLVLVVGGLAARTLREEKFQPMLPLLLSLTLVWGLIAGLVLTILPDVKEAVGDLRAEGTAYRYPPQPLAGLVRGDQTLLSEDPAVPIGLGRTPVILDPFMVPRLARERPDVITDMVTRLDDRRFDFVVLVEPLDDQAWWTDYDLGPEIIDAVRRNYVFDGWVDGYLVYVPRG